MTTLETVGTLLGVLGLREMAPEVYRRIFPTKEQKLKSQNDFAGTINTAIEIGKQLDDKLEKLVSEKTKDLENILMRRELEYKIQIENYSKRIYDGNEMIQELQIELKTAQTQILESYRNWQEEKKLKEQYFNELQDAKSHINNLEKRVSELEALTK